MCKTFNVINVENYVNYCINIIYIQMMEDFLY